MNKLVSLQLLQSGTKRLIRIVCSLKEYHEVGDHYLYICDVEQVYGDESEEALFAWNGYSQLRPAK